MGIAGATPRATATLSESLNGALASDPTRFESSPTRRVGDRRSDSMLRGKRSSWRLPAGEGWGEGERLVQSATCQKMGCSRTVEHLNPATSRLSSGSQLLPCAAFYES